VDQFVHDLSKAITEDMAEIRETELDKAGFYREATLEFDDTTLRTTCEVFVDRLGRVVTPCSGMWVRLKLVQFAGEEPRKVLKKEPRFEGERPVALVMYLESL
jgi:hypothetical protein